MASVSRSQLISAPLDIQTAVSGTTSIGHTESFPIPSDPETPAGSSESPAPHEQNPEDHPDSRALGSSDCLLDSTTCPQTSNQNGSDDEAGPSVERVASIPAATEVVQRITKDQSTQPIVSQTTSITPLSPPNTSSAGSSASPMPINEPLDATSDQTSTEAPERPSPNRLANISTTEASASLQPELRVSTLPSHPRRAAPASSSDPASGAMSRQQVIPTWETPNDGPSTSDALLAIESLQSTESTPTRWQPDAEATYCPICSSQFNIFVRKHHCRKCGRVVCNSCSPHRIIIPHQYIVRPPGQAAPLWGSSDLSPVIHGGERVRLCNPCVPDPNTAPPLPAPQSPNQMSPRTHYRSYSGAGSSRVYSPGPSGIEGSRSRSATMHTPQRDAIPSRPYPSYGSSYQSTSTMHSSRRYQSLIDSSGPSSSFASHYHHRSLPPPPPLAEEDECPVCHLELPSRHLANFEALRESHITQCIISHSASRSSPSAGPGVNSSTRSASTDGGQTSANTSGHSRIIRRTGMFPYFATEKDCVDSAECTICLEEFETGEHMARLECLCRFHLRCIRAWFQKHPGRCPVHQHDSFGY
ncbi:hypothetical protein Cpir12675_000767 [Ceratocystis pirilliformis]|uniref:RING-type E3 ubiquitin transferase n=1 Tax=Ceratocystis pirilliformis TaxID=259994 RepID=A0ABR3ZMM7_9PEZI